MATQGQMDPATQNKDSVQKKHKSHSRLIVFLICLVISILMWLFIELMKNYTDEIKYSITFSNVPKDLILTNSGDSIISIGMNAQGFELLVAKYALSRRTLNIDLSTLKIRPTHDGYTAYIPSVRLIEQLSSQIRFDKEIAYIKPDTLFFKFSDIYQKQVPVRVNLDYSISGQFDILDSVQYFPQSITVSSIKSITDTIRFVKTQKVVLKNVDSSLTLKVAIQKGINSQLIKYSADSVTIRLNVEKVTEAAFIIPVTIRNTADNVRIFPDKAEVICRVPLSEYSRIKAEDFSAEVMYDPSNIKEKKLRIQLINRPTKARVLRIVPADVEFIVIAK